mmetsp:Transcript_21874/g.32774  ORF Transcript_21874/g.32774 Transcript_21874/m.32774 type:complete len:270 (-) Transcript_21874:71-880(-)|eukprot:CAMPEP_0116020768 /NCGR_PEP_ID=MMETSP0321-20121206/9994_1 /TAXON_ID=163516 /ORGANISM="Leptocylindrus danicus var. danicus, Strain B650" /LENGTH=269 /DNA_ID=CAMNT_0003491523 /DNA_START=14 /DNA_END=823 /DNA_ORIENTATION=+
MKLNLSLFVLLAGLQACIVASQDVPDMKMDEMMERRRKKMEDHEREHGRMREMMMDHEGGHARMRERMMDRDRMKDRWREMEDDEDPEKVRRREERERKRLERMKAREPEIAARKKKVAEEKRQRELEKEKENGLRYLGFFQEGQRYFESADYVNAAESYHRSLLFYNQFTRINYEEDMSHHGYTAKAAVTQYLLCYKFMGKPDEGFLNLAKSYLDRGQLGFANEYAVAAGNIAPENEEIKEIIKKISVAMASSDVAEATSHNASRDEL